MEELVDLELVVLLLQGVRDDVGAKRNEFNAFEFSARFPCYVINTEL